MGEGRGFVLCFPTTESSVRVSPILVGCVVSAVVVHRGTESNETCKARVQCTPWCRRRGYRIRRDVAMQHVLVTLRLWAHEAAKRLSRCCHTPAPNGTAPPATTRHVDLVACRARLLTGNRRAGTVAGHVAGILLSNCRSCSLRAATRLGRVGFTLQHAAVLVRVDNCLVPHPRIESPCVAAAGQVASLVTGRRASRTVDRPLEELSCCLSADGRSHVNCRVGVPRSTRGLGRQ